MNIMKQNHSTIILLYLFHGPLEYGLRISIVPIQSIYIPKNMNHLCFCEQLAYWSNTDSGSVRQTKIDGIFPKNFFKNFLGSDDFVELGARSIFIGDLLLSRFERIRPLWKLRDLGVGHRV